MRTPEVHVHLLPTLIPDGALDGAVAIVLDVLRATTVMVHALDSGVDGIIPCLEPDEARAVASTLPPGAALLGGERNGVTIEGFDLGNSIETYSPDRCRGKTLVMTTTNGTRAFHAALAAHHVMVAAFSNLSATRRAAGELAGGRPIHVVCSGTDGLVSTEDATLAGALVGRLGTPRPGDDHPDGGHRPGPPPTTHFEPGNDSAQIALDVWRGALTSPGRGPDPGHPSRDRAESDAGLASRLGRGRGGRRVAELGLAHDIVEAARIDRFHFAAVYDRDRGRIVRRDAPGRTS